MYHVLLQNTIFFRVVFFPLIGFQGLISQQSVGSDYPFYWSKQTAIHKAALLYGMY